MTTTDSSKTLAIDISAFYADSRLRRNILGVRTANCLTNSFIDEQGGVVQAGLTTTISAVGNTMALIIYSTQPLTATFQIVGNGSPTIFAGQTLTVCTSPITGSITLTNYGVNDALINVIRLAQPTEAPIYIIDRELITFPALARLAPIGASVTTLANVDVSDVALDIFTNDQVTAPGTGPSVFQKYRICNSSGTPTPTGNYVMLLDDNVTQQNFGGTLQIWFDERAA